MKILLFRHGEIERGPQPALLGQTDVRLSMTGKNQALWWRDALGATAFGQVYCSDLSRARETAGILAANSSHPVRAMAELNEIDLGTWDGLSREEIDARFPGEWDKRGRDIAEYRPAKGESFADLAQRVIPAFRTVASRSEGVATIVGHSGVNRVILCHVLGMPLPYLFRLRQDYGALNVIEGTRDSWQVSLMNVTPASGALRDSTRLCP